MMPVMEDQAKADLFDYLPATPKTQHAKGEVIYGQVHGAEKLYLIVSGRVLVKRGEVVIDIYGPGELFGECVFAPTVETNESAVALDKVETMGWTRDVVDSRIASRPDGTELTRTLIEQFARRLSWYAERFTHFGAYLIHARLAFTLARFADRFGVTDIDGWVKMPAITQEILAGCLGTSRELVTHHMNLLRRSGAIQYSRQGIRIRRDRVAAQVTLKQVAK